MLEPVRRALNPTLRTKVHDAVRRQLGWTARREVRIDDGTWFTQLERTGWIIEREIYWYSQLTESGGENMLEFVLS